MGLLRNRSQKQLKIFRFYWPNNLTCCNIGKIIFPGGPMSKTGSANGSFFGNFIYEQMLRRRPHFQEITFCNYTFLP